MKQGKLQRQERRLFQAQKWEVDLGKALELPAHVRLERRSGIYHVAEFKYPNVLVDRVYRMDRLGVVAPAAPLSAVPAGPVSASDGGAAVGSGSAAPMVGQSAASASGGVSAGVAGRNASDNSLAVAAQGRGGGGLLDAGGGEVVWENAMVADHVMVQVEEGISREQLQLALPARVEVRSAITTNGLYLVSVPADGERSIERAVLALGGLKGVVQFAEPDFLTAGADTTPNDPLFTVNASDTTKQWHLPKIMAPRAWDVIKAPKNATVANQTVVAVVDTGVDYTHPDLAANMWINPGESGGGKETNNTDDDANGKKDDWRGWNFVDNNNNPMDDVGHGTHVAGIIGAIGNNTTGASGVCWGVKILPLRIIKALGTGTYGTYSDAVAALSYIQTLNATGRKVAVANHSWGGTGYSLAMQNAINNPITTSDPLPAGLTSSYVQNVKSMTVSGSAAEIAKMKVGMTLTAVGVPVNTVITIISGSSITLSNFTTQSVTGGGFVFSNPFLAKPYGVVHVAAAGNSRFNVDQIPVYPACAASPFVMSVAAVDQSDIPALWTAGAGTNYGKQNVDIFAPGSNIWSTKWKAPGDTSYGYANLNGTSVAAPQVAGALALVRMWQPNLTELQARQVVIEQVDLIPALNGQCVSGGRLNIAKAIDRLYQPILVGSGGSTGGAGISTDPLAGATALTGRLAVATTGYSSHALALVGDRVWSWGSNDWGELGDAALGSDGERSVPKRMEGLDEVRMVAVADDFSMALRADGSVWVWGANYAGQHGNGTADNYYHPNPEPVAGLTNIKWISAATLQRPYCLAVSTDGSVFAWGDNSLGQLGDGTATNRLIPQMVPGLNNIIQADAGPDHALAVTKDGAVYAWGSRFGQAGWPIFATGYTYGNFGWNSIGDGPDSGSLPDSKSPVLVPGLSGIVQVEATLEYSLALDQNGVLWEWGHFQNLDTNTGSHAPVVKAGLNQVVAIATGAYQSFAQTSDGQVFSWGLGYFGSLGTGSDNDNLTPQLIVAPAGDPIVSITGGTCQGMALTSDGKLLAWGLNERGQLGVGRSAGKNYPTQIRLADTLSDVKTDGIREFGLSTSGRLYVWGFIGDINLGGFKAYQVPKLLDSPVGIIGMDLGVGWDGDDGNGFMMAVSSDGSAYVLNTFQPPGSNPNTLGYANMVVIDFVPPFNLPRAVQVKGVAVTHTYVDNSAPWENNWHALFITSDGRVKGWGGNAYGQLGDNSSSNSWIPLLVTQTAANLSSVIQVSAGACHSMALKSDGTVWTWGRNNRGQLGNGTRVDRHAPIQVPGLSGIVRISAGDFFSTAIKADGTVYAWGGKYSVTFAELSSQDRLTPIVISGLGAIADVIPGSGAMLCLRQDGTAIAWANDASPILARDPSSTLPYSTPADVVGLSGVKHLSQNSSADFNESFAVKQDGTVWTWGGGTIATVLGDGDSWSSLPVYVVGFGGASETLSTLGTDDTAQSWFFQNFTPGELLQSTIVGDSADPDHDGILNLIEYALGLNPKQIDASGLPSTRVDVIGGSAQSTGVGGSIGLFSLTTADLTAGKHYATLTVPRNGIRQDINYIVEVSSDLATWRSGDPYTVTVLDTADMLQVYSASSLDDVPRQFMRLKIQRK